MLSKKGVDETSKLLNKIHEKAVATSDDIATTLRRMDRDKNIAFMHHHPILKYYTSTMKDMTGRIHFLEELQFLNYPRVYLVKNSFFTRKTDKVINMLNNGGFFHKWARDIFVEKIDKGRKRPKRLTVSRFYGLFIMLFIGWILAFVIF